MSTESLEINFENKDIKKPEDIPPEVNNVYPPHKPYAPDGLLKKMENEIEKKKKEEEEQEYDDEEEELEDGSAEIEKKQAEKDAEKEEELNFERELSREIEENEREKKMEKRIQKAYDDANEKVFNKNIEIMDAEFNLEILNRERNLLRRKRGLIEAAKDLRKKKLEKVKLEKEIEACELIEEEEQEDEIIEQERIERSVQHYKKALEINAMEKKIARSEAEIKKLKQEAIQEEIELGRKQADYAKYQALREKEVAEEKSGKWPGEPRWGMLYL